jgi:hypothetical protein
MSGTVSRGFLNELERRRNECVREAKALLDTAHADNRERLTPAETAQYNDLVETARGLSEHCSDIRADVERADIPDRFGRFSASAARGAEGYGRAWARDTAERLRRDLGGTEQRAVVAGSVDVPILLDIPVVKIPFPKRLIDAFPNRMSVESMAYEYYVQEPPRVNAAAPVPDLGTKSVSTLTVKAVTDRCRVIAHLSDYMPIRIWWDFDTINAWLYDQMFQCVLDAIEQQTIAGDGTGENMTGILNVAGTTAVPFTTDVVTTLRSAQSAMQNLGEEPTGWALNPADAQTIDLMRWGTAGGFLSGGYENDTGERYGTSDNVFGPSDIARVVTPHVPAGTAILADFSQLKLFFRQYMRLDIDPYSGFDMNAIRFRAESFVGIGILRPQAFAIVALT